MSHFSIGYQPEEGNGVLLKIALQNKAHYIPQRPSPVSYRKSVRLYLMMVNWLARPAVTGLTK